MSATIVIANVSKTGTSYFITDVVPSINLPALDERTVTDNHTPEAIQGSPRIKELFLAEELWIIVNGKKVVGYPILGPQPPPEFIPASDFEDLLPEQTAAAAEAAAAVTAAAASSLLAPAPSGPVTLLGDVIGPPDSNQLIPTGVVPGLYTNSNIAVDAKGRVTAASNGTGGGGGTAQLMWDDVPTGAVDGINTVFTLTATPFSSSTILLSLNGIVQQPGAGKDYTAASSVITFEPPVVPQIGDSILATYLLCGNPGDIIWNEVPTGAIDGFNAAFVLSSPPTGQKFMIVSLNGVVQRQGAGIDYTVAGSTINFTLAATPQVGDSVLVTYQHC